jgi:hypothetical protein
MDAVQADRSRHLLVKKHSNGNLLVPADYKRKYIGLNGANQQKELEQAHPAISLWMIGSDSRTDRCRV